jgi:hypothetical protein
LSDFKGVGSLVGGRFKKPVALRKDEQEFQLLSDIKRHPKVYLLGKGTATPNRLYTSSFME